MLRIAYMSGVSQKELIFTSAYLPYDKQGPPPTKETREAINYCSSRRKQLIIGRDANAPSIIWVSTGTNPRGESLTQYLVSSNMNILNQSNKSTLAGRLMTQH
jgi:hypothetical protein